MCESELSPTILQQKMYVTYRNTHLAVQSNIQLNEYIMPDEFKSTG